MSLTIALPQRLRRPERVRRLAVGVLSTAIATAGLTVASAPAQAAETVTAPSLTWKVSDYIANPTGQFADHTVSGGATETDRVVTFPDGVYAYDSETGATSIKYAGTFKAAGQGGSYSVTFADPTVTLDAAGEGTISADVSWAIGITQAAGPTRLTVTTFDAEPADWAVAGGLTKTPNWAGVLQPGTPESAAAGITNPARPVNGESFAPEFITFLNAQIKAFFYSTGTNPTSDALKAPAPFTAQAPIATVAAEATSSSDSVSVAVTGEGYSAAAPGIYVGVAESGLTDLTNATTFAGTIWSNSPGNPAFAVQEDGTFAATLSLTAEVIAGLDKNKSYSVYTFKAHGQNVTDPSQNAETPVAIDFSGFPKKQSAVAASAASSTFGAGSVVTVTVPTVGKHLPTGTVTLSGAGTQTATLAGGTATVRLPKTLAAGTTTLSAAYTGDANYGSSTATVNATVTTATVSVRRGATTKPTTKKTGKSSLTVKSSTGAPVDGKATVTFTKKGRKTKTKTVTIRDGKGSITIPTLAKGTWSVSVKYTGTTNFAKTATLKRGSFTVKK